MSEKYKTPKNSLEGIEFDYPEEINEPFVDLAIYEGGLTQSEKKDEEVHS